MTVKLTIHNLSPKAVSAILLLLILPFVAMGQSSSALRLLPVGHTPPESRQSMLRQLAQGDTLTLPFWDDFSAPFSSPTSAPSFQPDTTLWAAGSQHVRVNTGMAIAPPSVGVATFDGVDASGRAYSSNDNASGLSDSLVSKPINLALLPAAERDRVFFSFFWQQKGRGEMPDPEDSLRLQFKNQQGEWMTQWVKAGSDSAGLDAFVQEIIQVADPLFYHAGFQFRFQSYNRQAGGFDTWNVDYIYLNKNRSAGNTAYLDRALTTLPTSLFRDYTAIPMEIFREAPESFIGNASVGFYNLNVQLQPVRFTALVKDQMSGTLVAVLNNQNALSPVPAGFDRRTITAAPLPVNSLNLEADSLYLTTEFYLTSGDNYLIESISSGDTVFSTAVDYRVNDTVATTFVLDKYFAYDDGEAEFGVELNQQSGQLAYQYYTPDSALITHIDVHFPAISQNSTGASIRLLVWQSLGNDTLPAVVLSDTTSSSVKPSAQPNGFVSVALDSPVYVMDTFYIGYEQQSENIAVIGFDKNTNSGSKVFFNVGAGWQQNTDLQGSLMLRPRINNSLVTDPVTDLPGQQKPVSFRVYPNPSEGQITVEGYHDEIVLYNMIGQQMYRQSHPYPVNSYRYPIDALQKGLYILKIRQHQQYHTTKLIHR